MRKHRQGVTSGVTNEGVTYPTPEEKGVTYPAIVLAVVDPVKRKKLEKIYQELHKHGVDQEVRYGVYGPMFDVVDEIIRRT